MAAQEIRKRISSPFEVPLRMIGRMCAPSVLATGRGPLPVGSPEASQVYISYPWCPNQKLSTRLSRCITPNHCPIREPPTTISNAPKRILTPSFGILDPCCEGRCRTGCCPAVAIQKMAIDVPGAGDGVGDKGSDVNARAVTFHTVVR